MERNRPRPTARLRWAVENTSPAAALRSRTTRPSGWPARPPLRPARARTPAAGGCAAGGGWARRRRSRRASPSTTRPAPPASPARWTRSGSSRCSRTPPRHRSLSPTKVRRAHAPRRDPAGRRLVQSARSRQARDRALPSRSRFTSPASPGRAARCWCRPPSGSPGAARPPPARSSRSLARARRARSPPDSPGRAPRR